MAISFRHAFTSGKVDGTDSTLIQPSNWNAEHTLTLGAGKVLGRDSSAGGAAQELAISVDPTQQSMIPPSGGTGARPATAIAGMLRYNTSLSAFEGFMGSVWSSFVGLASDNTFTGSNTFSTTGASYRLRITSGSGNGKYVVYQTNGSTRWEVGSGSSAETGSNAGSSFQISRYDDSGTFIDSPIVISRSSGSVGLNDGSYVGNSTGAGSFFVSGAATFNRSLYFQTAFSTRWQIRVDSTSESGSSAGSNFAINRYNDSGTSLGSALTINRATGLTTLESLSVPSIDLGNTDTTITRVSAGVAAIEGKTIALNGTTEVLTTGSINLGNASDTTITRFAAGVAQIEGYTIAVADTARFHVASSYQIGAIAGLALEQIDANNAAIDGLRVTGAGALGYGTGSGGSVIQLTSKSTTVTLNKTSGRITTTNDAMLAGGGVTFLFANSTISATDVLIVNVVHPSDASYTSYYYEVRAHVLAIGGNAYISLKNVFNTSLSDAVIINFAVIKGVTS